MSIKVQENAGGDHFVDESCIACWLCLEEAPVTFVIKYDGQYAFVSRHHEIEKERAQ